MPLMNTTMIIDGKPRNVRILPPRPQPARPHGRSPGVYDRAGRKLRPAEALLRGPAPEAPHWLDCPDWWRSVRPLRWATAISVSAWTSVHVDLIGLASALPI